MAAPAVPLLIPAHPRPFRKHFSLRQQAELDRQAQSSDLAHYSPWFRRFSEGAAAASASFSGSTVSSTAGLGGAVGGTHVGRQALLLPLMGSVFAGCQEEQPGAGGQPGQSQSQSPGGPAIVGFSTTVRVFASKQKPKLLTLHLDDLTTRRYGRMVKLGGRAFMMLRACMRMGHVTLLHHFVARVNTVQLHRQGRGGRAAGPARGAAVGRHERRGAQQPR